MNVFLTAGVRGLIGVFVRILVFLSLWGPDSIFGLVSKDLCRSRFFKVLFEGLRWRSNILLIHLNEDSFAATLPYIQANMVD